MDFKIKGNKTKFYAGIGGIIAAVLAYWFIPEVEGGTPKSMGAVVALMAVWWVFEVVPIAVTSLFPIVLMPALGIADVKSVTGNFANPTIFLFLGGFLLALGLQESRVHRRIALHIVRVIGSTPSRLILGFMVATAFLSMWISNMASVMVMMPIGLSVLEEIKAAGVDKKTFAGFGVALMLSIAYSADMGGMATLIGTAPNMVFYQLMQDIYPDAPSLNFVDWMIMGLPVTVLFVVFGWLLFTKVIYRLGRSKFLGDSQTVKNQIAGLGPLRRDEIMAASVFGLAVFLWLTGSPITVGPCTFIGWREWLGLEGVTDPVVAIGCSCLLFLLPSGDRPKQMVMTWKTALHVPWGILLLFGGGFAVAMGFEKSGLSSLVGEAIAGMDIQSPLLMIAVISLIITYLTELTSNTAMTMLILPILAKASVVMGFDPRLLLIPATLSASCAFMMPIASPTQAIVFGSGYVPIKQMIRAGVWFNALGIILVTLVFYFFGSAFLDIDIHNLPVWAE